MLLLFLLSSDVFSISLVLKLSEYIVHLDKQKCSVMLDNLFRAIIAGILF